MDVISTEKTRVAMPAVEDGHSSSCCHTRGWKRVSIFGIKEPGFPPTWEWRNRDLDSQLPMSGLPE